jgi:hypothetical protein
MSGRWVLVCLCANLDIADEPAGNQRASRAYGPADQGHARRADGKLKVSAALAGRRIERKYSEVMWAGMLTGGVGSLVAVTPLS